MTPCDEYGIAGLCGYDCPAYGSEEECYVIDKMEEK